MIGVAIKTRRWKIGNWKVEKRMIRNWKEFEILGKRDKQRKLLNQFEEKLVDWSSMLPAEIIEIHSSVSRQEMKNYGTIDQRLPADLFNCFIKSPEVGLTTAALADTRHESYEKFAQQKTTATV